MICRVTSKVKLESGKWYQRKSLNGKGIECELLLYLDCEGISTGFYRKDGNDLKLVMAFEIPALVRRIRNSLLRLRSRRTTTFTS